MRQLIRALAAACCLVAPAGFAAGCGDEATPSGAETTAQTVEAQRTVEAPQETTPRTAAEQPAQSRSEQRTAAQRRVAAQQLKSSLPRPKVEAHPGAQVDRLVVRDVVRGDGEVLERGDTVVMDFVWTDYRTGRRINSTWGDRPWKVAFVENRVAPSLWEGLAGMRVGGRREIVVPVDMGGYDGRPSYFAIDLLAVEKG